MGRLGTRVGFCGLIAILAVGCQDKVAQENRDLRQQDRELQAQLDEAHRQLEADRAAAAARNSTPPAPAQPVVPTPPAQPTAVQPTPDIGGLESHHDAAAGTTTVTLPGDVFFDPGKADLKSAAKPTLDKVAAALKKEYGGKTVRVEGYTDTDPIKHSKWKDNQELSQARASAVRDYLLSRGVAASRVTVQGLGETKPKGTKAASRRVEVVVVTG